MKKFWKWKDHRIRNADTGQETAERILFLNGTIAEESWFDDDITPALFKEELQAGSGDITVWINSPGGDCVAAAQIYNMLMDYKGDVTVKIDGIAASAASVIAMAGTKVLISPVGMIMIHNPSTLACGDTAEMKKAASMLDEVKESIINAYEIKTSLPRQKLSRLMDAETWMDANKALELGFVDGILKREAEEDEEELQVSAMLFSRAAVTNSLMDKVAAKCRIEKFSGDALNRPDGKPPDTAEISAADTALDPTADLPDDAVEMGRCVDELQERLKLLRYSI